MDTNLLLLAIGLACLNLVSADTCERLKVDVTGKYKDFSSHSRYGRQQYSNNEDSCWIIQSQARIQLKVDNFILQPQDSDGVCVDYIKVYDSEEDSDDTKRLGTFCGREAFGTLRSTGDRMRVQFYSNGDDIANSGFKLKYKLDGSSELDPDAYWKAGLIFLFIFVFVVAASVIAVFAAYYTQKRLKPKVILVKKLKGKQAQSTTSDTKYDITGQPTPVGHLYPAPLHQSSEINPTTSSGVGYGQSMESKGQRAPAQQAPFTGHGPGMMEPGFGMTSTPTNEPVTSPRTTSQRGRPTTASQIRFD